MKKSLVLLSLLLVVLFTLTWCNSKHEVDYQAQIDQLESDLSRAIERWNLLSAELRNKDNIKTEDAIVENLSDENVIEDKAPVKNTHLNLTFGNQPTKAWGNYVSNTTQLNSYAHNNMVWMNVPAWATTMTINLKKDVVDNGRNIIVYVETNGRYCGWRILWHELGDVKGNTFTFDLTNMGVYPNTCAWDRSSKVDWKNISIGWYVTTYDGNWFNSITFN